MNINTNTLLNTLMTKVDSTIKAKLEKLSVDGKVDLNTVSKDKGIQTLLRGLFKEITTGTKNKEEVVSLLENSKQSLKFKNISTDVKQIINSLNSELKNNLEIKTLTASLQTSLLDIKNLDEKVLKSTFQNNGVFLESKLSKSTVSVSNSLEKLLGQLNTSLKVLNSFDKVNIANTSILSDSKVEKNLGVSSSLLTEQIDSKVQKVLNLSSQLSQVNKQEVQTIVGKINSVISGKNEPIKIENALNTLNEVVKHIEKIELKTASPTLKSEIVLNLKELTQQAKNNLLNNTSLNVNKTPSLIIDKSDPIAKNDPKVQKIITLSNDLTPVNKKDIQNIVIKIESSLSDKNESLKIEKSLDTLNEVAKNINKIELKTTSSILKNEIVLNLKELAQQAKNNLLNNTSLNVNKSITLIKEQIENIKSDNTNEIKTEIKKLDMQINNLNNEKNLELKIPLKKEIIEHTSKIIDTIKDLNIKELLKNNISQFKNISGDVKNIMLQMKETIEQSSNNENISKELKNNVDKVLSQIDYYQLASFSSNSNHGYLSFIQDDLEDVDVKFNNKNNEEFSCLIHLSLKEKGDLKILLQLDNNKGLNINIGVEQDEFKSDIQNALQTLRMQINSLGLSILSLNVFDLNDELNQSNELKAYSNNDNLDFGLDIKV